MILIDTHIWVWAAQGTGDLSNKQAEAISTGSETILLSAISIWETAMLIHRGKLDTTLSAQDWIDRALMMDRLHVVELTPPIVCQSIALPEPFHKDPADRLITATALVLDIALVTSDKKIIKHSEITTIK